MKLNIFQSLNAEFKLRLKRRVPNCKIITSVLSQSLDRRLSVREKFLTRLHLFACRACANYLKQIKFLRQAIQIREKRIARDGDSAVCEIKH
jgi:hypothetical protein